MKALPVDYFRYSDGKAGKHFPLTFFFLGFSFACLFSAFPPREMAFSHSKVPFPSRISVSCSGLFFFFFHQAFIGDSCFLLNSRSLAFPLFHRAPFLAPLLFPVFLQYNVVVRRRIHILNSGNPSLFFFRAFLTFFRFVLFKTFSPDDSRPSFYPLPFSPLFFSLFDFLQANDFYSLGFFSLRLAPLKCSKGAAPSLIRVLFFWTL